MTRMQKYLVAGLCLLPTITQADQPSPQAARAAELMAIIESAAVTSALKDAPILSIQSLTSTAYKLHSENCTAMVSIVYDMTPSPRIRPGQFDVKVTGAFCG
jgi:hypothetical protein